MWLMSRADGAASARPTDRKIRNFVPQKGLLFVELERLKPTQCAVGPMTVALKLAELERRMDCAERLDRFLAKRPVPAVLGPDARLHIFDHHHLVRSMWQARIKWAYVQVENDWSDTSHANFWRLMRRSGRLYPFDEAGRELDPSRLPDHVAGLKSDPYRDLATFVRRRGGFRKSEQPYSEFSWARYFREHIPPRALRLDFKEAIRQAMRLARHPNASHLPGYRT